MTASRSRRVRYLAAIKLIAGLLIIAFILYRAGDLQEVFASLAAVKLPELVLAALCLAVAVGFNALRWRMILSAMGARISLGVTLVGTFEGMFFNLFLPTGVGGDAVRGYRAYDSGLGVAEVVQSALIDRALGLWGLSLFLLVATSFSVFADTDLLGTSLIAIALVIAIGGFVAALVGRALRSRFERNWIDRVRRLVVTYGDVVLSRNFVQRILPVLIASNIASCASAWYAFRSVGLNVSMVDASAIVELASLSALLPISIGGWGLREGVIVFMLEEIGFSSVLATAASATVSLTVLAVGAVGLAIWLVYPYRGRNIVQPELEN